MSIRETIKPKTNKSMAAVMSAVILAILVTPVSARTLGVVADNSSDSVIVFDTVTNTIVGSVSIPPPTNTSGGIGDVVMTRDNKLAFVTNFNYQVFVIDLTGPAPELVKTININNYGEDLTVSLDNKYILVSDGSVVQPVDVIDIASQAVVSSFSSGTDTNSIDICNDGSVLVTSENARIVRRLTLDASGVLTNTGETLSVDNPNNVYCAPNSLAGFVVSRSNSVTSFRVPGLTAVDTRTLSGNFGISGAISPRGDRVYIRSNGGYVDQFSFDPTTAALGATPLWSIAIPNAPTYYGIDQMALGSGKLFVSQPNVLKVFDATTGGELTSLVDMGIIQPTGVAVSQSLPFKEFNVLPLFIDSRLGIFVLTAYASLGDGNDGIEPSKEEVSLVIGDKTFTIPANSFRRGINGYSYIGRIGRSWLRMSITRRRDNRLIIEAQGVGDDFKIIKKPVNVGLEIGNDQGGS